MKKTYIYVSDTANGTVTKYHPDGSSIVIAKGLNQPTGLVLDGRGNLLYVANTGAGTIVKFDLSGNQSIFAPGLNKPTGLALDRSGNLYVANAGSGTSGTIVKLDSGGKQSAFAQGLDLPSPYLAFDSGETLYASTTHTVEKFAPDGTHTTVINDPNFVFGIAFDCCNTLYASLQNAGSIKGLPGNGLFPSDNPYTFAPLGLAIDHCNGLLYAAFGKSVRKYHLDGSGADFVSGFASAQYVAVYS